MTATDLLFAGIEFAIVALEGVAALLILGGGVAAIGVGGRARRANARHAMSHVLLFGARFHVRRVATGRR